MHKINSYLFICMLISGCATATNAPAPTLTSAPIVSPTTSPTPTPEPTPTPVPLEGRLFFDMNGSGLMDEASFNYDAARLTDERQPLQADLLAAINAYVAEHPDLKTGDLITLEEPGLSGYSVCAKSNCVTTDAEGKFQLIEPNVDRFLNITIKDPNAGTPELEMRYINKWKREVTVPAYEMNGVQVPEQHLNDTSIFKLSDGATLQPGSPNEIGLMQGFLTLPFVAEQVPKPFIWNYFDIIGIRLFNNVTNYWNSQDGHILNYNGIYNKEGNPFRYIAGVSDSHNGLDFVLPVNNFIVNTNSLSSIYEIEKNDDGENLLILKGEDKSIKDIANDYGHLNAQLLAASTTSIYRGQIIALSGDTGTNNTFDDGGIIRRTPQLHWDLARITQKGWHFIDPFRTIVNINETPKDTTFWESNISYWTVDNMPIYPPRK